MTRNQGKAMNPYIAGALAGLLAVVSAWLTGKFFGASTTFVRAAGMIENLFAPGRVAAMEYYVKETPKVEWQGMFLAGILIGSLVTAVLTRSFRISFVPDLWKGRFGPSAARRAIVAFAGGAIAIFGARLADGCPSGHGLSGLMQLAVSGFVALACFFIGGAAAAQLIYRGRRPE
jgi:uncharacterized protein